MSIRTDDLRIASLQQLIAPVILMDQLPITEQVAQVVANARQEANAEIRRHRLRRMLLAIQRGFVSTLTWSPLAVSWAWHMWKPLTPEN